MTYREWQDKILHTIKLMSPGWPSNKEGSGEKVSPRAMEHGEAPAPELLFC